MGDSHANMPDEPTPEPLFFCIFEFAGCKETFQQKNLWEEHISILSPLHGHHYRICEEGSCAVSQDMEYFVCEEDLQKHLSTHKVEILQSRHKIIYPGPIGDLECSISECKRTIKATDPWDQRVKHIADHVGQPADATRNISEYRRLMITWALNENLMKGMDGRYTPTTLHDIHHLLNGPGETFNTCQSEENTSGGNDMSIIQRTEPSSAEYRQMPVTNGKSSSPHGGSSNGPNNQRGQGFDSSYRRHELSHEKPFVCDIPGCPRTEGFSKKQDVDRHKRSKHPSAANNKRYQCYIQGCKSGYKSWTRPDNFRSHVKTMHKEFSEGELSKIVQRWVKLNCTGFAF